MSIQAVAWALEQDKEHLPAGPKLVLIAIANHADHTNGYCWLKAETIAREASCTTRSVYNCVGALVRNGYLRKAPRKGEDGKQRANDYWIVFRREDKPWHWGAHPEANEAESEADEIASEDGAEAISSSPKESNSYGETIDASHTEAVEKQPDSRGPCEVGFTRYESLEPSKSNPKRDARAMGASYIPRNYRPPPLEPPQPQGVIIADKQAKMIFVFAGTRAWDAWIKAKRKETGVSSWNLTTTTIVDGERRTGWWFPALFPPQVEILHPIEPSDPLPADIDDYK
jgi:hypothetical protein